MQNIGCGSAEFANEFYAPYPYGVHHCIIINNPLLINELAEQTDPVYHIPVLLNESVDALDIDPGGTYVDLTFGGGGHSREILRRLSKKGRLVAFDQDADAAANVPRDKRIIFAPCNFKYFRSMLRSLGIEHVDGVLADLGVSSHHFDASRRGFSFRFDSTLDMRMNQNASFSALDVVNGYGHADLLRIIRDYGELKNPQKIANDIIAARPIETTKQLVEALEAGKTGHGDSKFLAKLFQAVRIEVNGELEALKMMLEQSAKVLRSGGRMSVITYHSLEDRLVKNFFRSGTFDGEADRDIFGNSASVFIPDKKVVVPDEKEIMDNPRARSAKLRGATRKQ